MKRHLPIPLMALALLSTLQPHGTEPKQDPDNYCYQAEAWANLDKQLAETPGDTLFVRMYAVRKGLCALIEEKKIPLNQAVEIFELERSRAIIERQQDETRIKRDIGV